MDTELIFMGYIPTIISVGIIVFSFLLLVGKKIFLNALLFTINFSINIFALSIFIPMLYDSYPTILPHLLTVLTIPILVIQYKLYKKF